MAVLGALPHYYLFGATFLAAVSLLLERGPLLAGLRAPLSSLRLSRQASLSLLYSEKNVRTVCFMKCRQLSFYGGGVRGVRRSNY